MKEIWNSTLVNPPPNLTYEIKGARIDAAALSKICCDAVSVLNNQQTLHLEAAALSRVLYRTKVKMRFDKGIMYMAKVNRCLLQYLSMDLASAYNSLKMHEEDGFGIVCAPSRQRLEWVLVRTQGFAKLFCHIMRGCENAAYYMMCRMHLGHVFDLALLSLALVSRIWTISRYLILQCCKWYKLLKPYKDISQPVGVPWLPVDYEFPEDLQSWLDTPSLTAPLKLRSEKVIRKAKLFGLIDLDYEDTSVEDSLVEPEKFTDHSVTGRELPETQFLQHSEDIGELVVSNTSSPSVVLDSGNNRGEPKKKQMTKNPVLEQHLKHGILNKTGIFLSDKKRKRKQPVEDGENEVSVNTIMSTSGKRKKNIDAEQKVQNEGIKKNIKHGTEMENSVKSVVSPSKKNDTEFQEEVVKVVDETTAKLSSVKHIKTVNDLKVFLVKERKSRKKSKDCATKSLDKLQWHMFEQAVVGYIQTLSLSDFIEGSRQYRKILKQAKKEILIRIQ